MAKRDRQHHEGDEDRKPEQTGSDEQDRKPPHGGGGKDKDDHHDGEHRREPHGTGYGTERRVYEEYLSRKWEGSPPPNAETRAEAVRLWQQLPGSIVTSPSELGAIPKAPPPEQSGDKGQHQPQTEQRDEKPPSDTPDEGAKRDRS
jgi:hypothetical protein